MFQFNWTEVLPIWKPLYPLGCFNVVLLKNRLPLNKLYFLKSFSAILFAFLILLSSHRETFIYLSFKLNQSYIVKNLCVNKDEPVNSCCGKCVLKKQLDENRKQEERSTNSPSEIKFAPLFFVCYKNRKNLESPTIKQNSNFQMVFPFYFRLLTSGIFHPPRIWQS